MILIIKVRSSSDTARNFFMLFLMLYYYYYMHAFWNLLAGLYTVSGSASEEKIKRYSYMSQGHCRGIILTSDHVAKRNEAKTTHGLRRMRMQIFLRGWSTFMYRKEVSAKVGPPPSSPSSPKNVYVLVLSVC